MTNHRKKHSSLCAGSDRNAIAIYLSWKVGWPSPSSRLLRAVGFDVPLELARKDGRELQDDSAFQWEVSTVVDSPHISRSKKRNPMSQKHSLLRRIFLTEYQLSGIEHVAALMERNQRFSFEAIAKKWNVAQGDCVPLKPSIQTGDIGYTMDYTRTRAEQRKLARRESVPPADRKTNVRYFELYNKAIEGRLLVWEQPGLTVESLLDGLPYQSTQTRFMVDRIRAHNREGVVSRLLRGRDIKHVDAIILQFIADSRLEDIPNIKTGHESIDSFYTWVCIDGAEVESELHDFAHEPAKWLLQFIEECKYWESWDNNGPPSDSTCLPGTR